MRQRPTRSFVLAVLMFAARHGGALAEVNIPDWVLQAAAAPAGTYPPLANAVGLLDQTDLTGTPDCRPTVSAASKRRRPRARSPRTSFTGRRHFVSGQLNSCSASFLLAKSDRFGVWSLYLLTVN